MAVLLLPAEVQDSVYEPAHTPGPARRGEQDEAICITDARARK